MSWVETSSLDPVELNLTGSCRVTLGLSGSKYMAHSVTVWYRDSHVLGDVAVVWLFTSKQFMCERCSTLDPRFPGPPSFSLSDHMFDSRKYARKHSHWRSWFLRKLFWLGRERTVRTSLNTVASVLQDLGVPTASFQSRFSLHNYKQVVLPFVVWKHG